MMTYQVPDSIKEIAWGGEFNEFDLNEFFEAGGNGEDASFKYKEHVQKWLDLIRGVYLPSNLDDLKLGSNKKPPMPYSDTRLLNVLSHTVWFLPGVASCYAMKNLLAEKQNAFFHDYKIIVCAGVEAGGGMAALEPVQKAMDNPLETKQITKSSLTVRELRNARPVVMGFPRHGAGMTERKVAPKIVCKKIDSGI